MGRLVAAVTIAMMGLLLVVGPAGASHKPGKTGPARDFVRGNGAIQTGPILVRLHVKANSHSLGQGPRGHLTFRGNPPPFGAVDFDGRVTCLNVFGNQAIVGFVVTESRAGFPVGTNGEFSIFDGGKRGSNLDRFEGRPTPGNVPSLCLPFPATNNVTEGNFLVHDALP